MKYVGSYLLGRYVYDPKCISKYTSWLNKEAVKKRGLSQYACHCC